MVEGNESTSGVTGPLTNVQILKLAWRISGGYKQAWASWDFRIAIGLTALCFPVWLRPNWWEMPLSIVPNLLGFTLSGFAIFLGFGSDSFKTMISSKDPIKSEYLSVSAAFLIFVFFQILTVLYAIVCKSLWFPMPGYFLRFSEIAEYLTPFFWAIGFFLLIYSVMLGLRAAIRIFRVSRWYNDFLVVEEELLNNSSPVENLTANNVDTTVSKKALTPEPHTRTDAPVA